MGRGIALLAVAALLVGCVPRNYIDRTEPTAPLVYYTPDGIERPWKEVGRVTGEVYGACRSSEGVFGAVLHDALKEARAKGADAILIVESTNIAQQDHGTALGDCYEERGCLWPLVKNGIGEGRVGAIAIKFTD